MIISKIQESCIHLFLIDSKVTSMLSLRSCDYSDAYILVSGTITITGAGNDDAARRLNEINKEPIFKN